MNKNLRKLSLGLYFLIILVVLIELLSLSGLELDLKAVVTDPTTLVLLILTLIGFVSILLNFKNSDLIASLMGALAFVLIIVIETAIENSFGQQSLGISNVFSGIGYFVLMLLFLVSMGVNGYAWKQRKFRSGGKIIYCPKCGKKNSVYIRNCSNCNHNLYI